MSPFLETQGKKKRAYIKVPTRGTPMPTAQTMKIRPKYRTHPFCIVLFQKFGVFVLFSKKDTNIYLFLVQCNNSIYVYASFS